MNIVEVNEEYERKMIGFESDCNELKGEPSACHHVGEFYSVVKDNHKKAFDIYSNNCNHNNYHPSCFNLAKLYLAGKGTEQNDEKAKINFYKACEGDHLPACYHYGIMNYLFNMEKIKANKDIKLNNEIKEIKDSIKVLESACIKGNSDSCYFAGGHFINKDTLTDDRNPTLASQYFTKSCDMNHAPSCYNLAVLYKHGDVNVKPNDEKFNDYKNKTMDLINKYGDINSNRIA